jgi:protein-serine/threonine kinase
VSIKLQWLLALYPFFLTFHLQNHKQTFAFPIKPAVSSRCQDLMRCMIQEKSERLCSKRYNKAKEVSGSHHDHLGRSVYPSDAEDIKSHRWFKDIQWEQIHQMTPPFVPSIKSLEDTHYFDEEEPISDFSTSHDDVPLSPPTEAELDAALRCFNREIQILARNYVVAGYDTVKLRRIEREIDSFAMCDEQKEYLRAFVKAYGHKERKRPRDRLLRDKDSAWKVLEVRKRDAFLGYSYRRIRKTSSQRKASVLTPRSKKMPLKQRLSIF